MIASTTGGGSLRIRNGRGGAVVLDAPVTALLGSFFAGLFGLGCLVMVRALVTPPWDETFVGVLVLLLLAAILGGVAALGVWLARLGRSRLLVEPDGGRLRAAGPRWWLPPEVPLAARSIRVVKGPKVRHGETSERRTWIVRVVCGPVDGDHPRADVAGEPSLDVLQAWDRRKVERSARSAAEAMGVPLEIEGDRPAAARPDPS